MKEKEISNVEEFVDELIEIEDDLPAVSSSTNSSTLEISFSFIVFLLNTYVS